MTPEEPAPPTAAQEGLEAFAALAAHQLGEAIALMRGAAAVLEDDEQIGPGGQDALRAMNAGGTRAQRYVDDLLDIVRTGSEPDDDGARARLDSALDDVLAELAPFLRRAAVHVQREPLPHAALARADARRLFLHAVRSALAAGATRLGATGRAEEDCVVVEMYDNGTPHPDPASAFAPFSPPRGRGPLVGAGVSLQVMRRLAARADGSIAMEVRPDGATVITMNLPKA
jgi:light-regulated signal transduction histidine kinase (bacteriophytochrome)